MIIVNLKGGLGNQLFQYAFGRSLALDTGEPLVFHMAYFRKIHTSQTNWPYELDKFNVAVTQDDSWLLEKLYRIARKEHSLAFRLLNPLFPIHAIAEQGLCWQESTRKIVPGARNFLDGYWQSEKYFRHHRHELLQEIVPRQPLTARSASLLESIRQTNSVTLHVRRGDYVTHAAANAVHGTCGLDYYRAAIDHIERCVPAPVFHVFSDDIAWAREHLQSCSRMVFADYSQVVPAHEDLYLISQCRHQVIANSSFSWWGAWLNANPEKIVIAPKRWFQDENKNAQDLVPAGWIRL